MSTTNPQYDRRGTATHSSSVRFMAAVLAVAVVVVAAGVLAVLLAFL